METMEAQTEPTRDSYDAIVVGSGLGGVSAAAYLSKFGRRVLLVERLDGPGGYAHAYRSGPYTIDPAIHVIAQCGAGETVDQLLDYLGVRDACAFLPLHFWYRVTFPGFVMEAPFGPEAFVEEHVRQFPHDAEGIRKFFGVCAQYFHEARQVALQLSLRDLDKAVTEYPTLFKYRTATVQQVLDEYVTDARFKAVSTALWPYVGLPPSRLSFEFFARFLVSQMEGLYHCQGSFQNLVDAFVTALRKNGGELIVNSPVARILVEDGKAAGVALQDGREVRAPIVISNADARQTIERLVGAEQFPTGYLRRLQRLQPSISVFVVYAATSLDLRQFAPAHETFIYNHWDHDRTWQDILSGSPGGTALIVPTLVDPSLAPEGEYVLTCMSLAAYDTGRPWEQEKEPYTDRVLGIIEGVFPGFRKHTTFVQSASPLTLERYTGNYRGAAYGWENTPEQAASKRLTYETPIPGLYLSGHWTQAASALRVIISGTHTAQMILRGAGVEDVGPRF
jgi:phytoene dehydrogenase-like protein